MKFFRTLAVMAILLITSFTFACGTPNNNTTSNSDSNSVGNSDSTEVVDSTLAENYDFGSPDTWAGESLVVTDLGDAIVDVIPYDDFYDWGQSVIWDEDDGLYKMWWCRQSRYDSIWYAESYDLKTWFNAQKVMAAEENTTWIKLHVGKPAVLKVDGEYIMLFEAPATLNGWKEFDNNVFLAKSQDGKKWTIKGDENGEPYPVIRMSDAEMERSWGKSQEEQGSGYGYYGIGQPSVTYKDGTYYVYCTYSLENGDRMYVYTTTDFVNYTAGYEVFVRAGSGVKYNTLTQKFMYAYEYTLGRVSKVYYMESTDGYNFTYSNYSEASGNQDVLSKGTGFVRGYPDFVCNGQGQVTTHTIYAAFMEGRMADSGNDWRQYSNTWDIHFSAVNLKEYANRTAVLPNGRILNDQTIEPYRVRHVEYDDRLVGISKTDTAPQADGVKDSIYDTATVLEIDRVSYRENAVPGNISATAYVGYTAENLYVYAEIEDDTNDVSDTFYMLIDEKRFATDPAEILNVTVTRTGVVAVTDGNGNTVEGVQVSFKQRDGGYVVEVVCPWRYKTTQEQYDSFGFDIFVYNNRDSAEYKSIITWADFKVSYSINNAGELFFR